MSKQNVNAELIHTEIFEDWEKGCEFIDKLKGAWLYRGQSSDGDLETSLERECMRSNFELNTDAEKIENNMIRHF